MKKKFKDRYKLADHVFYCIRWDNGEEDGYVYRYSPEMILIKEFADATFFNLLKEAEYHMFLLKAKHGPDVKFMCVAIEAKEL
jgi:hypothetical protein